MTFTEFFEKKRIDLSELEKNDTKLYVELKESFDALSPKSFDQIKKYSFNRLRLRYPLKNIL